jgi:penicillin-binding protein 2
MLKKLADGLRTAFIILIVLASVSMAVIRLLKIQISGENETYINFNTSQGNIIKSTQTINATRGEIVDVNGNPIVENKVGYNVIIQAAFFPDDLTEGNEILLKISEILKDYDISCIESIPVTMEMPYEYISGNDDDIEKLKKNAGVNVYATAENCISKLILDYSISNEYTDYEKRIIAGLRYEMQIRNFSISNVFTLAEDVPLDAVVKIKEYSPELSGIDIIEAPSRTYAQTDVIPHEIGTVGPIYAEEYEELKELGYAMDDNVGKSGIEKGMEQYLRGKNGTRTFSILNGNVVGNEITEEAVAGNTIKLTINSDFQRDIQNVLENFIVYLNNHESGKYTDVSSGAIAVIDVKTGAVLALATAPTYTMDEYIENYQQLLERDGQPIINRATDGIYRPGSTFKTITASAGLNEGIVDSTSTFYCSHEYNYYDITVHCTGYHQNISVTRAIEVSCNIYFYELGQRLGIDKISEYAALYGLGQSLGLESGDSAGYLANPETFENLGMLWTRGQVLQAAIGQSEVGVTPLQLAVAASTIANEGTRYKPHLVDSIYNYDMSELIEKIEPEVAQQIDLSYNFYPYIKQGMIAASHNTPSGEYSLNDLGFDVAIKTGTPQSSRGTDSTFIGFAPADNPQIAFAGIIEGGEYSKYMVRKIIDAYCKYYDLS